MKIYINDKKFDISTYDDSTSIIEKYAISIPSTLPSYLRYSTSGELVIEEGAKLKIDDVRELLSKVNIDYLTDKNNMSFLLDMYPSLSKKDIVILWFIVRYSDSLKSKELNIELEQYIDVARTIDRYVFVNTNNIIDMMKETWDNITKQRILISSEVEKLSKMYKELEKVKCIDISDFNIEGITLSLNIKVENGIKLSHIFDSISVSENIPFVVYVSGKTNIFKLYDKFIPPDSWIDQERLIEGVYFKLKTDTSKNIESNYIDGIWNLQNIVEISFSPKKISQKDILLLLKESISSDLNNYDIINQTQISVKGVFEVKSLEFDKIAFADMVFNTNIISSFLFFNERILSMTDPYISATTKKRFIVYYKANHHYDVTKSMLVMITSKEDNLEIRVSRAKTMRDVEIFKHSICRILKLYNDERKNIQNLYKDILPQSDYAKEKKKKKVKKQTEDKKTGRRLYELKKSRPGIFRAGYSSLCQPMSHQPYLIKSKEQLMEIRTKYGDHKVLEYTDPLTNQKDWYACEPREPGEENIFIWPGLRRNTKKSEYSTEVPYVPCCFEQDQYVKKGSLLNSILHEKKVKEATFEESIVHILNPNKLLPQGRFGSLSSNLRTVVQISGYPYIDLYKQTIQPILRTGVLNSPDSILHCMLLATDPKYQMMNNKEKIKEVSNLRVVLSNQNLAICKQELYDYSYEKMKDVLTSDDYLDPSMWIRLMEKYFKVNILMFGINQGDDNSHVVTPRFSKVHLQPPFREDRKIVILFKMPTEDAGTWPYQCEIIGEYNRTERFMSYLFDRNSRSENERTFIDICIEAVISNNKVYAIYDEKIQYYN